MKKIRDLEKKKRNAQKIKDKFHQLEITIGILQDNHLDLTHNKRLLARKK
ncbi:MAG: hypothetical protein ACTSO9_04025 [Candidatus Helarchaeota archaeon]